MSNLFNNLSVVLRPWSNRAATEVLPHAADDVSHDEAPLTQRRKKTIISPLAVVDRKAEIGDGVEIGPFCVVGPNVTVGDGNRLHNNVTLAGHSVIGEDNEFFPNAVIGAAPQDKKYRGEATRLEIGHNNLFREACSVHVGTVTGCGVTRIGDDNLFMVNSHLGHDVQWGSHTIVGNNCMIAGHVVCGDYVALMGGAGVHHFVTLGDYVYIAGYAQISHDTPPYTKIDGDGRVRASNLIGLRRNGFDEADVGAIDDAVRHLFLRRGTVLSKQLAQYDVAAGLNPHVRRLVEFLRRRNAGKQGRYLESFR